jgi:hypothetical protein
MMKNRKYLSIVIHLAAWTVVYFLPELFFEAPAGTVFFFKRNLHFILVVLFFYLNYFILVPKLLLRKKQMLFALALIAGLIFTYYINDVLMHEVRQKNIPVRTYQSQEQANHMKHRMERRRQAENMGTAVVVLIGFFISTVMRETREWYIQGEQGKEMEKQKLMSELSFLKSQVNPHFLFNSLNGIYALAIKKSDKTPDAILQLSDLMRHMLYESEKEWVDLSKEVDYLKNYIALQKLRLANNAVIDFEVKGDIEGKQIEPMLFIPFIENAFKHGVDSEGADIHIQLEVKFKRLYFSMQNRISTAHQKDEVSGIGLANVKKRLDLHYGSNYKLDYEEKKGIFSVNLQLNLKS